MLRTVGLKLVGLDVIPVACVVICGSCLGFLSVLNPETVLGVAMAAVWTAIVSVVLYGDVNRNPGVSWNTIRLCIGYRVALAFAYIGIVLWFYGGAADYVVYRNLATAFGEGLLRGEPFFEGRIPINRVLAALFGLFYFMAGSSVVGMFVLSSLLGLLGSYLVYRAFEIRIRGEKAERRFLFVMLFTLPSFVLWTSVLGKESWMLFFLGLTMYSFANVLVHARLRYYLELLTGLGGATIVRPAVGAILVFSVICSLIFLRARSTTPVAILRPVVVSLIVIAGVVLFWDLTSIAIADKVGETIIQGQSPFAALAEYHRGLALDAPSPTSGLGIQIREPTASGVLRYLPKGMFTLLFRPFIFEAHNVLALAAALESMLLLFLLLARIRRLTVAARFAMGEPFLAFCWISFVLLAALLSLGANFGVMIRQRVMVLPFLMILLAVPAKNGLDFVRHRELILHDRSTASG